MLTLREGRVAYGVPAGSWLPKLSQAVHAQAGKGVNGRACP